MPGAAVGDLYMSLIDTCYLSGADPFEYLTELQRNHERVRAAPGDWLPWNYRQQLTAAGSDACRPPPAEAAATTSTSPRTDGPWCGSQPNPLRTQRMVPHVHRQPSQPLMASALSSPPAEMDGAGILPCAFRADLQR